MTKMYSFLDTICYLQLREWQSQHSQAFCLLLRFAFLQGVCFLLSCCQECETDLESLDKVHSVVFCRFKAQQCLGQRCGLKTLYTTRTPPFLTKFGLRLQVKASGFKLVFQCYNISSYQYEMSQALMVELIARSPREQEARGSILGGGSGSHFASCFSSIMCLGWCWQFPMIKQLQ